MSLKAYFIFFIFCGFYHIKYTNCQDQFPYQYPSNLGLSDTEGSGLSRPKVPPPIPYQPDPRTQNPNQPISRPQNPNRPNPWPQNPNQPNPRPQNPNQPNPRPQIPNHQNPYPDFNQGVYPPPVYPQPVYPPTVEGSGKGLIPDDEDLGVPSAKPIPEAKSFPPLTPPVSVAPKLPPYVPDVKTKVQTQPPLPVTLRPGKPIDNLPVDQEGYGTDTEGSGLPPILPSALPNPYNPNHRPLPDPQYPSFLQPHDLPVKPCVQALREGQMLPYRPHCRPDWSERYLPRQCSHTDCFCVNRTSGALLDGTTTLLGKPINCTTFLLKIVIGLRLGAPGATKLRVIRSPEGVVDPALRPTVASLFTALHLLYLSTRGNQQLSVVSAGGNPPDVVLNLSSTGHSRIEDVTAPLRSRLDEGWLGEVQVVPQRSSVRLIRALPEESKPVTPSTPRPILPKPDVRPTKTVGEVNQPTQPKYDDPTPRPGSVEVNQQPKKPKTGSSERGFPSPAEALLRQPGIIAAMVGGGIAGFLLSVLLLLFCIYRIRKKDEGSYALDEPKKVPISNVYARTPSREFYA